MEVLISTTNLKNQEEHQKLLQKMRLQTPSITINQIEGILEGTEEGKHRVYTYSEKGVSKSRNRAIQKLEEEIGLIADDDLEYVSHYEEIIKKAYQEHPKADMIAFYVETRNGERKTKKRKSHRVNKIDCMHIFSFQISFKKESVQNKIQFDEMFGAGSYYSHGEEAIFLEDALRQKLKIYYCDEKIGTVSHSNTSWFKGYNEQYLQEQGAVFYRMSKTWYNLFLLQFAIRKGNIFPEIDFNKRIRLMKKGVKDYKNMVKTLRQK